MIVDKIKRREWLIVARERRGMSPQDLAIRAGCSEELINRLEDAGYITHPNIAARIVRVLRLNNQTAVRRYNELVNEIHRADKLPPNKTHVKEDT